jgi:putative salt-induced outer membrane protein
MHISHTDGIRMGKQFGWVVMGTLALCGAACADEDAPPPAPASGDATPDSTWAMRALAGLSKTSGNTDTTTANGLFHVAHVVDDWKFLFGAQGLYGSNKGITTAQDFGAEFQANYNINERLYWFSGLNYDNNKFSGFAYQEMLDTGLGYQFIKTDDTKLTGQVGVGVQRLRPETYLTNPTGGIVSGSVVQGDATSDAVGTAAINFEHSFNSITKLLASVAVQSGSANTMTTAGVGLQVKMSDRLSLAAAYQLVRNSKPPDGIDGSSGLTTLNLVYELKNPKLAPQ